MRAAREERQHPLMLCWELGQIWKGAVGQETVGTCPVSSDGENLGESRWRGRGHIWEVVLHSVLSQTEPGWRGSSDCPHVDSILVVLAMAGVAAYICCCCGNLESCRETFSLGLSMVQSPRIEPGML